MADEKDEELSVAASTSTASGGVNWVKYVSIFLPQERATEWSKEELVIEQAIVKEVGADVWNAIPKDIRINIMRGNAHEKERLKVTCASAKGIYEWRAKYKVDAEALTLGPLPGSEKYHAFWPTRVAGVDMFGHPILYDRFSTMDLAKLIELGEEEVYKYRTQALESLMFLKAEIGQRIGARVSKHVYILDLAGLDTSKHFTSAIQKKMRPVMKMSADMFPETLWTVWVINAPATFRLVWAVVRGWLDPVIRAKVRMWGSTRSKWQTAMAECGVPVSALPAEFGGTAPSESLADILVRAAEAHRKKVEPSKELSKEAELIEQVKS